VAELAGHGEDLPRLDLVHGSALAIEEHLREERARLGDLGLARHGVVGARLLAILRASLPIVEEHGEVVEAELVVRQPCALLDHVHVEVGVEVQRRSGEVGGPRESYGHGVGVGERARGERVA